MFLDEKAHGEPQGEPPTVSSAQKRLQSAALLSAIGAAGSYSFSLSHQEMGNRPARDSWLGISELLCGLAIACLLALLLRK